VFSSPSNHCQGVAVPAANFKIVVVLDEASAPPT